MSAPRTVGDASLLGDDLNLDVHTRVVQGTNVLSLRRTEGDRREDDLAAGLGGDTAELKRLEREARLMRGARRVNILEQQEDVAVAERAGLIGGSGVSGGLDVDVHAGGRGHLVDARHELVLAEHVVNDDDLVGGGNLRPLGNHLAVNQAVVDACPRNLAHFLSFSCTVPTFQIGMSRSHPRFGTYAWARSSLMWRIPSCAVSTQRFASASASSPSSRLLIASMSIGRFAPATR